MSDQTRFLLNESDLPKFWYNVLGDVPSAVTPVLNPLTMDRLPQNL
jgi:tryptophan synthase beta chain